MIKCPYCKHEFEIPKLKCTRCGHEWIPRGNKLPTICPKCKNPYWNRQRVRNLNKKNSSEAKK